MGQNPPIDIPPAPPASPQPDPELERLRTENARQTRELALAQARADFPNADKAVLEMFQGTAEDIRKFAETLHTKESERLAALSHGPGPAPTPGPGGTPSPQDAAAARYAELGRKVQGRYADPQEVEEFSRMAFVGLYNGHMEDRKGGKSSSLGVIKV